MPSPVPTGVGGGDGKVVVDPWGNSAHQHRPREILLAYVYLYSWLGPQALDVSSCLHLFPPDMTNLKELALLRTLHWRLLVALFVINVSVFSYGFDNSVYSTTQAMDSEYTSAQQSVAPD